MSAILIVEDELIIREPIAILLRLNGYTVDEAANGFEALEACSRTTYDLILLDLMMPLMDGAEFLEKADLATHAPHTNVVVLSNLSSGELLQKALSSGAVESAVKSNLTSSDIVALVQRYLPRT